MKTKATLFAMLICLQIPLFAQLSLEKISEARRSPTTVTANAASINLDSIIIAHMNALGTPGLATLIVKDNKIVWNKNYGYRDVAQQLPVEDSTSFMLMSISKTFVATAVMQLWEHGLLDLDRNVNAYLPKGFVVANPNYPTDSVTARMLLAHTSSIQDYWGVMTPLRSCEDSPLGLLAFLKGYLMPSGTYYTAMNFSGSRPGQSYNYTNIGTSLLAVMVENVTGQSFVDYCRDSIFIPLSMDSASWFLAGMDLRNIATPYVQSNPACHEGAPWWPSCQLRCSKIELSHFLEAYMNYGLYENHRILDSTTIALMLTDQLGYPIDYDLGGGIVGRQTQGLIWFQYSLVDGTMWLKNGASRLGAETMLGFDPNNNSGFIILMNACESSNVYPEMTELARNFCIYLTKYSDDTWVGNNWTQRPTEYLLQQNYPNPFNPSTAISYQLPAVSHVTLKIYNLLGQEVGTLVDEKQNPGNHSVVFEAGRLPSGVYFYRLNAGKFTATRKLLLLK